VLIRGIENSVVLVRYSINKEDMLDGPTNSLITARGNFLGGFQMWTCSQGSRSRNGPAMFKQLRKIWSLGLSMMQGQGAFCSLPGCAAGTRFGPQSTSRVVNKKAKVILDAFAFCFLVCNTNCDFQGSKFHIQPLKSSCESECHSPILGSSVTFLVLEIELPVWWILS